MNVEHYSQFVADSRLASSNSLFFALPGENTDGHHFLEEVKLKGATGAVVSKTYSGPDFGLELFRVDDPLVTLQELAREHLKKSKAKVIGITGSIGKTTTKEFIAQILSTKYKIAKTLRSQNTKITLPLTILNDLLGDEDFIVLEMGMTHPGDIANLVSIAPPTIAVLTQIALVHAINFTSLDDLTFHKKAIFSSPKIKAKIEQGANLSKEMIEAFKLPGAHNLYNLSLAVAACHEAGMTEFEIVEAISDLALPEKRLEFVSKNGILFINDSYNACWPSMKGAFDTLKTLPNSKKIAILGDMKEQGTWSKEMHQNVLDYAEQISTKTFLIGSEWEHASLSEKCILFKTKHELLNAFKHEMTLGDAVLVKGSNSHKLWTILEDFV